MEVILVCFGLVGWLRNPQEGSWWVWQVGVWPFPNDFVVYSVRRRDGKEEEKEDEGRLRWMKYPQLLK